MNDESHEQGQGARRAARESLLLMGQLLVDGAAETIAVRIRNLSATGMMAESAKLPERGARATIELRNIGNVSGTVVWIREGRFGMAFDTEIDPSEARKPVGSGGAGSNVPDFLRPRRPLR